MKRSAFLFAALVLLFTMAGCGNQSSTSQAQTGSSQVQSGTSTTIDEPSSEDAVSSDAEVSSEAPVSSAQSGSVSSQTQQEVSEQVQASLKTKVPLLLPQSVPVEQGYSLTATTTSQTWDYTVNFYETAQPAVVNSKAASKGTLIATVEGTEYKDASSAQNSISGYQKADVSGTDQILNLGHNIKAVEDAGAGHQWLTWNEGRWCLRTDSPNDPTFQNKEYPDPEQLAKDVVAYLEENTLPVPQQIGVISMFIWNQSPKTTVRWQQNQMVYQITSQDPMTALKLAVAVKSN